MKLFFVGIKQVTCLSFIISTGFLPCTVFSQLVAPCDLEYAGGFVVPAGPDDCMVYSGQGMACCPEGDPNGKDDGYPGSLYYITSDATQAITEITIPAPADLSALPVEKWPVASFVTRDGKPLLSPLVSKIFIDVNDVDGDGDRKEVLPFDSLAIPVSGIAWTDQTEKPTVHFCVGSHIQGFGEYSHAFSDTRLSRITGGPYIFTGYSNYTSCDYMFELPPDWVAANTPGLFIASGRYREGYWCGRGPALFACNPRGKPGRLPAENIVPLLLYGIQGEGSAEIENREDMQMRYYCPADQWTGADWLTVGSGGKNRSALIFAGTRALGDHWYGFAEGTRVAMGGISHFPHPPPPPFPHGDQGFWSTEISQQIIFYDTEDIAKTAAGKIKPHQPQPFARLDINNRLVEPKPDFGRYRRNLLGACCFDRKHGFLYVCERIVAKVNERSVIHVFRLRDAKKCSLAVSMTGKGTILPSTGKKQVIGAVRISATPAEGYYFAGWKTGGGAKVAAATETVTSVRLTEDGTVAAEFIKIPPEAVLTMAVDGKGKTLPEAGKHTLETRVERKIHAEPAERYLFSHWSINGHGKSTDPWKCSTDVTLNADMSLTAHFVPIPPAAVLSVNVYGYTPQGPAGGSVLPVLEGVEKKTGEPIKIAAKADKGYNFIEWRGTRHAWIQESASAETIVKITGPSTVAACFANQKNTAKLKISSQPAGGGTLSPPAGIRLKPAGEEVPVSARPAEEYVFERWVTGGKVEPGDSTRLDAASTYFVVNGDGSITARFVRRKE